MIGNKKDTSVKAKWEAVLNNEPREDETWWVRLPKESEVIQATVVERNNQIVKLAFDYLIDFCMPLEVTTGVFWVRDVVFVQKVEDGDFDDTYSI